IAHLSRKITCHEINAVGEILPRTADALHNGLPAQPPFGADFARHTGHFSRERAKLIHHSVDTVLQLENLTAHIDSDLPGEIASRNRRSDFCDVADLSRKIAGHRIDAVRQILPGARDAFYNRLPAEFSFRAYFAGHASDFRRE